MLFKLEQSTEARLVTFTARTEKHGTEDVAALTLGLAITGPNLLLDKVSETLRHALYRVADDYTEALENIDPPTTVLRTKQLAGPLSITVPEIKGGMLYVEWGIGEDMVFSDIRVCVVPPPLPADDADEDNGAPLFEEPSDARLAAEAAFSDPGAEGMDPNAGFDATDAFVDAHAAD